MEKGHGNTSMLRPSGNRPSPLPSHLGLELLVGGARVHVDRLGTVQRHQHHIWFRGTKDSRQGNVPLGQRIRGNQLALAAVPFRQHLGRRRASEDAGVDEAGELDVRDVAAGAVDAFEIPDGFGSAVGVSGLGVSGLGVDRKGGKGERKGEGGVFVRGGIALVEETALVSPCQSVSPKSNPPLFTSTPRPPPPFPSSTETTQHL